MSDRRAHRRAMARFALDAGLEPRAVALLQYIVEWGDLVETPPTEMGEKWLLVPLGPTALEHVVPLRGRARRHGREP